MRVPDVWLALDREDAVEAARRSARPRSPCRPLCRHRRRRRPRPRREAVVPGVDPDRRCRSLRVLGDVRERLDDDVVRRRLHSLRDSGPSGRDNSTDSGARSASRRIAAGSPRFVSETGWMPRASSRSSCIAPGARRSLRRSLPSPGRPRPSCGRPGARAAARPVVAGRRREDCARAAGERRPPRRRSAPRGSHLVLVPLALGDVGSADQVEPGRSRSSAAACTTRRRRRACRRFVSQRPSRSETVPLRMVWSIDLPHAAASPAGT